MENASERGTGPVNEAFRTLDQDRIAILRRSAAATVKRRKRRLPTDIRLEPMPPAGSCKYLFLIKVLRSEAVREIRRNRDSVTS
jgi:hypothetical protein